MIEAHNLVNLEGSALESALKKDFGLEITGAEKVEHGYSSQVYKAHLGDRIVFIRINKKPQVFETEILGYKAYREKGIPVPEVIAYQPRPASIGHPTMIMASAEGTSVGTADLSPEQKDIVYERMGELLRKIHEIKLDGFGSLKTDGGELKGEFKTWKEWCESRDNHDRKAISYLLENKLVTPEESEKVKRAHEEIASLNFGQASLLHRDIQGSHVFVTGKKITGVIDLGRLLAGDPRYDIAMSFAFQTSRQRECFKKGYGGEIVNDPVVLKYLLTIAAGKVSFRSRMELKEGTERILGVFRETLSQIG